jgi:hypothetical protein
LKKSGRLLTGIPIFAQILYERFNTSLLRILLIVFAFFLFIVQPASGQEKNKIRDHGMKEEDEDENPFPLNRVEFGINFGAYFPNKYPANFYNGTPENVNNINYVLSNPTWFREIRLSLGIGETDTSTQVTVDGYPTNMHYNIGFTGGLFLRVNLNRRNGIFLEANYVRMQAADAVTILIYNPYSPYALPDYRMEQVIGKEGRVMIDLGYQRSFPMKSRINLFIQGGGTMCYTQMIKSVFVVEGKEYNLVNVYGSQGYQPGYNNQTYNVNQNAFGFGGYLGAGAGIPLTDVFGIEPGFFTHFYPVNLQGYPDFRAAFALYLRILIHSGSAE